MVERILSHQQSKILSFEEVASVSAAGLTSKWTAQATYPGGPDGCIDVTVDY